MVATTGTSTGEENTNQQDVIPPLENGDRLTRQEFERRFDAMTHLKHAELIEGVVYFLGLNLNVPALLDGKLAEVLAEVQQGKATEAHQRFVNPLSQNP